MLLKEVGLFKQFHFPFTNPLLSLEFSLKTVLKFVHAIDRNQFTSNTFTLI